MMKNSKPSIRLALLLLTTLSISLFAFVNYQNKPSLYLIGDSTVRAGTDVGGGGLWGWGHFIGVFFNSNSINVENDAQGGTSTRSFMNLGLWNKVLTKLKPGDFVIMQFGHNDQAVIDDSVEAKGTLKGIGEDVKDVYNVSLKRKEVIHSYGWYIRKYINDIKAKGATPVVCSPVPFNVWKDGKTDRRNGNGSYGGWAQTVAQQNGAYFIDLNKLIADDYDSEGETKVRSTYFSNDNVHTIEAGAKLNASMVVMGIKSIQNLQLNKYLLNK